MKRLEDNPFEFPISRICMEGYSASRNCSDLLRGWGGVEMSSV
jgi:hypothetical protein